jgi:hypothetical protein
MEKKVENSNKKKIITAVIWIIVFAGLILAANVLVSNFDVVGFLKSMHGG